MTHEQHGLSIGIERFDNEFLLTFKVVGKLTHEDYQVIVPMIESALEGVQAPRLNILHQVGNSELLGTILKQD